MKRITRSEYVEIVVGPANGKSVFYFPDQPNLRGVNCEALEVYSTNDAPTTLGMNSAVTPSLINNTFVILYFDGGEFIKMPLSKFNRLMYSTTDVGYVQQLDSTLLNGQNIVWTKSYIQFVGTAADISNLSYAFNIHYKLRTK